MGRWTWRDNWADRNFVWVNKAIVHTLSLLEVVAAACEGLSSGTTQKVGMGKREFFFLLFFGPINKVVK